MPVDTRKMYSNMLRKLHDICMMRLLDARDLMEPDEFNKYWDNGFNSQFRS